MRSKSRKSKNNLHLQHGTPRPAAGGSKPTGMSGRKWLTPVALVAIAVAAVALIAVVTVASFAVFAFILPGKLPPELVGEWRVVGGDMHGMTLEFKRNGTMIGKAIVDGKDHLLEGQAEVTGTTLRTTTTNPFTGRSETGTQTIVSLTETELVTEDAKGTRITMKRVR
jgi:uncharacterized protein (TIGR03066 family)